MFLLRAEYGSDAFSCSLPSLRLVALQLRPQTRYARPIPRCSSPSKRISCSIRFSMGG